MAGHKLHILENEPVLIRNKHINGYLVRTSSYDNDRNNVEIIRDLITERRITKGVEVGAKGVAISLSVEEPLGYSSEFAKWNLVSKGSGTYEIVHCAFNEPLYAASDGFAYDSERRRVLTWKPGPSVTQGFWKFEETCNGYYLIKNTQHGEYLYGADYPSKGWVFTWRSKDCMNDKFYWQLLKA